LWRISIENAIIERFDGTMRRECVNVEEFNSVLEARVVIGQWVETYNTLRRHRGLGGKTPAGFLADYGNLPKAPPVGKTDRGRR
jgi:transposase InsO family protein